MNTKKTFILNDSNNFTIEDLTTKLTNWIKQEQLDNCEHIVIVEIIENK